MKPLNDKGNSEDARVRFPPPPLEIKDLSSPRKAELGSSCAELCQVRQLEGSDSNASHPAPAGQQVGGSEYAKLHSFFLEAVGLASMVADDFHRPYIEDLIRRARAELREPL